MLAHSFLIKSSSKLLVTRTGIKARMSLISGLWFPWPIYMFFEMRFDLGTLDSGEQSLPFRLLVLINALGALKCMSFENEVHETWCYRNKELWYLKSSSNDIWPHFSHEKCSSVNDRRVNIRINMVHTHYQAKRRPAFKKKLILGNTHPSRKRILPIRIGSLIKAWDYSSVAAPIRKWNNIRSDLQWDSLDTQSACAVVKVNVWILIMAKNTYSYTYTLGSELLRIYCIVPKPETRDFDSWLTSHS